jgi:dTDP-glucose 4,6-dehydratase
MKNLMIRLRAFVGGQAVVDGFTWLAAVVVAAVLRFEFRLEQINFVSFLALGLIIAVINFVTGKITGLYRGIHKTGSLSEGISLAAQSLLVLLSVGTVVLVWGNSFEIPRSTLLIATPIFFVVSGAIRIVHRSPQFFSASNRSGQRTLVYGAGEMAEILIPQLLSDPDARFQPVGLIDDDVSKSQRRILGVRCLGNGQMLSVIAKKEHVSTLVVAIPRADSALLAKIQREAKKANLEVVILPTFSEILANKTSQLGLRELGIEDLVGRRAIEIDSEFVRSQLKGKRIMVTGAGGSIGVEVCRQVAQFEPAELIYLDRDESGLQMAQLAAENHGLLDSGNVVLADIREKLVLESIFSDKRPDVVFHAAALKHLPVLERYPLEAWKTNVVGTANLLEVLSRFGVETFVNISTDKAADPTSTLGVSKLFAEQLTAWYSRETGRNYVSVRFGNVLGSRGSLVPTVTELIRQGGPVTLTDPEATRFFMTVSEACQLVLQATALAEPGDVLVLDMGEPVKVLDIVEKMIDISNKSIPIVFRGLRPGEKLHERLFSVSTELRDTSHPLVWRATSPELSPKSLDPEEFMRRVEESAEVS